MDNEDHDPELDSVSKKNQNQQQTRQNPPGQLFCLDMLQTLSIFCLVYLTVGDGSSQNHMDPVLCIHDNNPFMLRATFVSV